MPPRVQKSLLGLRHVSFVIRHIKLVHDIGTAMIDDHTKMMEQARRIDRMSSIESEPMTLRRDQIHFAREAALYVLQTSSMEEAMRIFTEGLEPVVSAVGMKAGTFGDELEFVEADNHHHDQYGLQNPDLRDVVTAPF